MIDQLFGSKLRAKILGWLFSHPDEHYYVRQLTALLVEDSTNVSRELSRLERLNILTSSMDGKQKYYQVNHASPVYNELHGLIVKTVGVAAIIRSALEPAIRSIKVAFIFGSVSIGTEKYNSDIDLMIIGKVSFDRIVSLISSSQIKLGREINPVVYSITDFAQKLDKKQHFLNSVIKSEKIFIKGDDDELAGLIERRLAKTP